MGNNGRFYSHLKKVTIAHVFLLIMFLFWGVLGNFFKKKDQVIMPIEFMVAVPSSSTIAVSENPVPQKNKVTPKPKPQPKSKPKPKSPRKVQVNNKRVVRNDQSHTQPNKLLTPEEIEKRLRMGAKAGDKNTAIPDEDSRGYLLIKQTLYDLWLPPDREVVGDKIAKVTLKLSSNGAIIQKMLIESSGVQQMDSSVSAVLNAVVRIPGLPAGFLARHINESITITFKVQ